MRYKRVMLKLSGGALAGDDGFGFDHNKLKHLVTEILSLVRLRLEVGVVVGGGNILRGKDAERWGVERTEADNIGMLGTVINGLMLRGALRSLTDKEVRVMTAMAIPSVAEPYIRLRALQHFTKGYLVIFAGGNGQPFVTTDYPSVQRALETDCDALLAAKSGADGVFDRDPNIYSDAEFYPTLTFDEAIRRDLRVMDPAAFILARDHGLPLHVFNIGKVGAAARICQGEDEGTTIHR
ncbi:MAG: Uridine monophosphate kinase [uncultured Truepera sp.]|uniref:Uridylate kinase n=1 Tax=uncultured Truepera sp. TaxID=543023 RepID=A0A6J4V5B1_9DEIN|nr:MAG: Uridine monophosphate kinase [uncultured Truepera sp.]